MKKAVSVFAMILFLAPGVFAKEIKLKACTSSSQIELITNGATAFLSVNGQSDIFKAHGITDVSATDLSKFSQVLKDKYTSGQITLLTSDSRELMIAVLKNSAGVTSLIELDSFEIVGTDKACK